jgi:hypothetical protein
MKTFLSWLIRYRKPIGYVIGGLNLLAALNYWINGQAALALLWVVIGSFIIWDAYDYHKESENEKL